MGKTGILNTIGFAEGNMDKYLKDIFISIIELVKIKIKYVFALKSFYYELF
jgi:hypothetical protein